MGTSLYSQVSSSGKLANCGASLCWADECVRPYAISSCGAGENCIIQLTRLFIAYGFLTIHYHQLRLLRHSD
jgi:hypothetical protein